MPIKIFQDRDLAALQSQVNEWEQKEGIKITHTTMTSEQIESEGYRTGDEGTGWYQPDPYVLYTISATWEKHQ